MKKVIVIGAALIGMTFIPEVAQAATAFPSVDQSPELAKVGALVDWSTRLVQIVGSSVAGLRATVCFYDMIMGDSTDQTKKSLIRIAYGLAGLFFSTHGINYLVKQFLNISM